ncbi:MAG: hypothetical protein D6801_06600 [Alphaproteobacteria bacterium]|nr:MAG: hypothetical protein D6801_06600 [Alphaproteobacteria bacterium]
MPLDRFVLVLIIVLAGAGLTVWLASLVAASLEVPAVSVALVPLALLAYVLWRVIAERLANREDDHYDRIEK